MPEERSNAEKFQDFHHQNPQVYARLVELGREFRCARGPGSKVGIATLWERLRWDYEIMVSRHGEFKLNNNHRAYYARIIMDNNPELAGLFDVRSS